MAKKNCYKNVETKFRAAGLRFDWTFVPQCLSRNRHSPQRMLNWKFTLVLSESVNGNLREMVVLANQDYMQGAAYIPDPVCAAECRHPSSRSILWDKIVSISTEQGKVAHFDRTGFVWPGENIAPPADGPVIECLLLDAQALDYADFSTWAESFGYSSDSIAVAELYVTCRRIGENLLARLGAKTLSTLREALEKDNA